MSHSAQPPLSQSAIRYLQADLNDPRQQADIVNLIDAYAQDPMANGTPLPEAVREALIPGLQSCPTTQVFLAYDGWQAVGIAVCFLGFSTFAAKPLLNIHDFAILPTHRSRGIAPCLLDFVSERAKALGCCKLTLEVLANNHRARGVYEKFGFSQATYRDGVGGALFFSKSL